MIRSKSNPNFHIPVRGGADAIGEMPQASSLKFWRGLDGFDFHFIHKGFAQSQMDYSVRNRLWTDFQFKIYGRLITDKAGGFGLQIIIRCSHDTLAKRPFSQKTCERCPQNQEEERDPYPVHY